MGWFDADSSFQLSSNATKLGTEREGLVQELGAAKAELAATKKQEEQMLLRLEEVSQKLVRHCTGSLS